MERSLCGCSFLEMFFLQSVSGRALPARTARVAFVKLTTGFADPRRATTTDRVPHPSRSLRRVGKDEYAGEGLRVQSSGIPPFAKSAKAGAPGQWSSRKCAFRNSPTPRAPHGIRTPCASRLTHH